MGTSNLIPVQVAGAGIAKSPQEGWMEPLAPDAVVRVEVQLAPAIHKAPLKALERSANGPNVSPKQELLKRRCVQRDWRQRVNGT